MIPINRQQLEEIAFSVIARHKKIFELVDLTNKIDCKLGLLGS